MRRHAAVLAGLLVGLAVVVAPATPAAAHTKLSKAVPAAKSTVTKPVTALTLTFSGLIKQAGSEVTVRGADGAEYQEAEPRAVDKTITQRVRALPVGGVTVAWKTVSGDGHAISGSYTFTNKAAPPVPTASPTTAPAAEPTSVPTRDVVPVGGDPGRRDIQQHGRVGRRRRRRGRGRRARRAAPAPAAPPELRACPQSRSVGMR